jgi:Family of unknown function (DUF6807)
MRTGTNGPGIVLAALVLAAGAAGAEDGALLASIRVESPAGAHYAVPMSIALRGITERPAQQLQLRRVGSSGTEAVPLQLQVGDSDVLTWLYDPDGEAGTTTFQLREAGDTQTWPALSQNREDGLLVIAFGAQRLLGYQFAWLAPPRDVDPIYGRSGFIHPLWSPRGQVLTRIQPEDHYHHYGIWNPWTHVEYEGQQYDLWNLVEKQGTVRFAGFAATDSGPVYSEFAAVHEHVANTAGDRPVVIMKELQTVRVYRPFGEDYYLFDMTIDLATATGKPVTLLEYRYGGFGWRATEQWDKDNSEVLSSEGRDRDSVDNTLGRWFYVQGAIDDDYAGALVMSHPGNFNHPEPMRIWPVPDEGRGDVFASFSPTKNTDWKIEPGRHYLRTYRWLVYNGRLDKADAESVWQAFATPPKIVVEAAAAGVQ